MVPTNLSVAAAVASADTVAAGIVSADMVEPGAVAADMVKPGTAGMVEPGTVTAGMVEPGVVAPDTVSNIPLPCALSLCTCSRLVKTADVPSSVSPGPVNTRGVPADHKSNKVPSVSLSSVNNKVSPGRLLSVELASGRCGSVMEIPAPVVPRVLLLQHPSSVIVTHSPAADTIPDSSHD